MVLQGDLIKLGLIPEFIGRVPVTVSLDMLDKEALIKIMTKPKNAITKQYQKLFELDDVKLEFDKGAVEEVANLALERKIGARGLRSILEGVMTEMMYEIPSDPNISICTITKETIDGGEPDIVYRDKSVRAKKIKATNENSESA